MTPTPTPSHRSRPTPRGRRPGARTPAGARSPTAALRLLRLAAPAALAAAAAPARGQLPGLPVAPVAFVRPGLAAAVNAGRGEGRSTLGIAVAWGQGGGRLGVTAGGAAYDARDLGGQRSEGAWGARVLVRGLTFARSRGAVSAFGGVGGVRITPDAPEGADDASQQLLQVPVGAVASWRVGLGAERGLAASLTPFYNWTRSSTGGDVLAHGLLRFSASIDVAATSRLGVTLAWEGGATAPLDQPGPRGSIGGVGVSFGFGGR